MNPLLVTEAVPKSAMQPEVAGSGQSADAVPGFAAFMEGEAELVDVEATPFDLAEMTDASEEAGDEQPLKQAPLMDEPAQIQVVLPETAKPPLSVLDGKLIEIKNLRAAAALTEGTTGKIVVSAPVQDDGQQTVREKPEDAPRSTVHSVSTAQTVIAAQGRAALEAAQRRPSDVDFAKAVKAAPIEKGFENKGSERVVQNDSAVARGNSAALEIPKFGHAGVPQVAQGVPQKEIELDQRQARQERNTPPAIVQPPILPTAATVQTGMVTPTAFSRVIEEGDQLLPRVLAEPIANGLSEGRSSVTVSTSAGAVPITSETARHVAQQVLAGVAQGQNRTTEIALNPEELGRVKMKLTASEGAVTLVLLAERPETNDLLRRHIDVLEQEFRAIGYDSISFAFGSEGGSENAEARDEMTENPDVGITEDLPSHEPVRSQTSGLDVRV